MFANCQRAIACVQESYHVNVGYWYAVFHPSSETPAAAVIERGVRLRHHLVNDGAPLVANQSKAEQEAQVDSRCRALIWRRLAIWEAPARVEPARRGKDVAEYVILGEDALHPRRRPARSTRQLSARQVWGENNGHNFFDSLQYSSIANSIDN